MADKLLASAYLWVGLAWGAWGGVAAKMCKMPPAQAFAYLTVIMVTGFALIFSQLSEMDSKLDGVLVGVRRRVTELGNEVGVTELGNENVTVITSLSPGGKLWVDLGFASSVVPTKTQLVVIPGINKKRPDYCIEFTIAFRAYKNSPPRYFYFDVPLGYSVKGTHLDGHIYSKDGRVVRIEWASNALVNTTSVSI